MTTRLRTLRLTSAERDCLAHRLEAPDSLAEALSADYATEDVYAVCKLLTAGDLDAALEYSNPITQDVLAECVEGSTWAAVTASADPTDIEALERAAVRTLESLGRKIGLLLNRDLIVPN